MPKKAFFGLIIMFCSVVFVGVGFGVGDESTKEKTLSREYCKLTNDDSSILNNKKEKSRTFIEMKARRMSLKSRYKKINLEYQEYSNTYAGVRKECNNPKWFNNKTTWFDRLSNGKNPKAFSLTENDKQIQKNESACYDDFIKYASDIKNYNKENNPYFQENWLNNNFSRLLTDNGKSKIKSKEIIEALYKKQYNSKKPKELERLLKEVDEIYEFCGDDSGKCDKDNFLNKLTSFVGSMTNKSAFTNKDIRLLQFAINILGCDKIMMDGSLGNYTIKSFCTCSIPPKVDCVDVEEHELGKFNIKGTENGVVSSNDGKLSPKGSINFTLGKDKVQASLKNKECKQKIDLSPIFTPGMSYSFACDGEFSGGPNSNGYIPMCCPKGTTLSEETIVIVDEKGNKKNVNSCCIPPGECHTFFDINNGKITGPTTTCGPNGAKAVKCSKEEKASSPQGLICPCAGGGDSETSDGGKTWDCPCVKKPGDECIEYYKDDKGTVIKDDPKTCGEKITSEANYCKTKQGIKPICPCRPGEDRKNEGKDGEINRDCPCVKTEEELDKCVNLKKEEGNECGPSTTNQTCITKDKLEYPICPCGDNKDKTWQYYQNKRQCPDCPPGEKFDFKKEKCVCDPAQQCCGIKLNTNVPWIGRCIEFGATNNTNKTVTNEYGDGNTTITVNVLNAFPVLMSALGKIFLTIFFLFDFGVLIYAGTKIASGDYDDGKKRIYRVAIGLALVGASGVILHAINPNFFL